jgi:hypothetical protein
MSKLTSKVLFKSVLALFLFTLLAAGAKAQSDEVMGSGAGSGASAQSLQPKVIDAQITPHATSTMSAATSAVTLQRPIFSKMYPQMNGFRMVLQNKAANGAVKTLYLGIVRGKIAAGVLPGPLTTYAISLPGTHPAFNLDQTATFTLSGINPASDYSFYVAACSDLPTAYNKATCTNFQGPFSYSTLGSPAAVTASAVDNSKIRVALTQPGALPTTYEVSWHDAARPDYTNSGTVRLTTNPANRQHAFTVSHQNQSSINPGKTYVMRFKACNALVGSDRTATDCSPFVTEFRITLPL